MSHRVTTETEIKDKSVAVKACQKAGYLYREEGNFLIITNGPMRNAKIDLKSGLVTGDTDHHRDNDDSLGALKQHYAEQLFTQEASKQGISVSSRKIDQKTGDIVLTCFGQFGNG